MPIRSTVVSRVIMATVALVTLSAPALAQFDRIFPQLPGLILEEVIKPRPGERIIYLEDEQPRPRVVIDDIAPDRCRSIQAALAQLGHNVGTVDGQCGPRTRAAISAFQESLGASPTGNLNEAQERALLAQATPPATPPAQPSTPPAQPSTPPAQPSTQPAQPTTPPAQPSAQPAPPSAPAVQPPASPPTPPRPTHSANSDIDCAALPANAQADCAYFREKALAVARDPQAVRTSVAQSCRALDHAISEGELLDCMAGAYALREELRLPRALFVGGWKGLGPVLDSSSTCSALVIRIKAVAASVTGDTAPGSWDADQTICRQIAAVAQSRQSPPEWVDCAVGSDPARAYRECSATGTDIYRRAWITAIANCAGGKDAAALNRQFATAAATAGRKSDSFTCEQIETMAVADGVLTETAIAGIRQEVADDQAAIELRERQRAEAEERERLQAEQRRLAEEAERAAEQQRLAAEQERIAAERAANPLYATLQAPPEYDGVARKIEQGDSFNFTDTTLLFTAGVASELLENCSASVPAGDRVELAAFVTTAALQAGGGNNYSAAQIDDMMKDQAGSMGVFTAGVLAARSMQCSGADTVLGNIADIVQDNKRGADGGVSPFIASCSPVHGQASCACLAELGRASYSNIYQMSYSRDLVYGIIQNNPMAGMAIAFSCGIMNY